MPIKTLNMTFCGTLNILFSVIRLSYLYCVMSYLYVTVNNIYYYSIYIYIKLINIIYFIFFVYKFLNFYTVLDLGCFKYNDYFLRHFFFS